MKKQIYFIVLSLAAVLYACGDQAHAQGGGGGNNRPGFPGGPGHGGGGGGFPGGPGHGGGGGGPGHGGGGGGFPGGPGQGEVDGVVQDLVQAADLLSQAVYSTSSSGRGALGDIVGGAIGGQIGELVGSAIINGGHAGRWVEQAKRILQQASAKARRYRDVQIDINYALGALQNTRFVNRQQVVTAIQYTGRAATKLANNVRNDRYIVSSLVSLAEIQNQIMLGYDLADTMQVIEQIVQVDRFMDRRKKAMVLGEIRTIQQIIYDRRMNPRQKSMMIDRSLDKLMRLL